MSSIAVNTLPFFSRFTLTLDLRFDPAAGLLRTQFNKGYEIPVFDYRKGDQTASALEGSRATPRDTGLVKAAQTKGGGLYRIRGVSITKDGQPYVRSGTGNKNGLIHTLYPSSASQPGNGLFGPQDLTNDDFRSLDALNYQALIKYFRCDMQIDGTERNLEFGPALLYPGVNGPVNQLDTVNGNPFVENYMHIEEGITWNPSGAVDSNFIFQLEAAYDLVTPTWTSPAGTANGEPASAENPPIPNAQPTGLGRVWTQGWVVNFHGYQESPVSNVA